MKIIGQTESGFILNADEYEVARLIGYYSPHECRPSLRVGVEIKVNAMFEQLYAIKSISRNVKEIESNAKALLDAIRVKDPLISPIVEAIKKTSPKES